MKKNTLLFLMIAAPFIMLIGCQQVDSTKGYNQQSLYRADIDTVFVKMFESKSFRREIEFELTRATCQQLELHSPYKIVSDQSKADTILYGNIKKITERVLTRQRDLDRPVENEVVMLVSVTWKDLRSGELLLDNYPIKVQGDYSTLLGGGRDNASREALNNAAVRLVEAMERPW